jgi:GT2 family glycosyltransferase
MSTAPRASVIIPTWNGRDLLLDALRSLDCQSFADFETIVVDNGSSDGTVAALAQQFPHVRVLELGENVGFAAGVNAGIHEARGEVIVLMNNDTVAEPGWLGALVGALAEHPEVGSCASKLISRRDPRLIDSAGVQFGLFASDIGHGDRDGPRYAEPRYVFAACAAAAAYRREALERAGLFDETLFAYFEDVDLGARLQLAGYRCLYVPDAVIQHVGSATGARVPARKFYLLMRNGIIVFLRYMPPSRLLWAPLILVWPFVRAVLDGQPQRTALQAVFDGLGRSRGVARLRRLRRQRAGAAGLSMQLSSPFTRAGSMLREAE